MMLDDFPDKMADSKIMSKFVWNSPREKHKKKEIMTERSLIRGLSAGIWEMIGRLQQYFRPKVANRCLVIAERFQKKPIVIFLRPNYSKFVETHQTMPQVKLLKLLKVL